MPTTSIKLWFDVIFKGYSTSFDEKMRGEGLWFDVIFKGYSTLVSVISEPPFNEGVG